MNRNAWLNRIFTQQEELISCSSLRKINTEAFLCQDEERSVTITPRSIDSLFQTFKQNAVQNAQRIARNVLKQNPTASIEDLITNILLNRRYRRGKKQDNSPDMIHRLVKKRIADCNPIQLTISLFPCKIPNRLKSASHLPDLAEVASLARLAEIGHAVSNIYKPGVQIIILTDGQRFMHSLNFDIAILKKYQRQLNKILKALEVERYITILDYKNFLDKKVPRKILCEKNKKYQELRSEYIRLIGKTISLKNPLGFLSKMMETGHDFPIVSKIIYLYYSLIYSNYFPDIYNSTNADSLTKDVYRDIFNMNDKNTLVKKLRKKIVSETWKATLNYVAEIASGRLTKPIEHVFPESIRCDMHNIPDRLTIYSVDRSTPLTAFHGTGFVDTKLRVGVRFRASLQKEGFQPVYGKMLGVNYTKQPLFYIHKSLIVHNRLPRVLIKQIHLR